MDEILNFVLTAISGPMLGYYFYWRAINKPVGVYSIRSTIVLDRGSKPDIKEKITVICEEQSIPRLSVAVVALWNGSSSTLDGRAINEGDPLRISFNSDVKILEATMVAAPNPNRGCKIATDSDAFPNSVLIDFKFLNRHDVVAARIVHTGDSDSLTFAGGLDGVRMENEKTVDKTVGFLGKVHDYTFHPMAIYTALVSVMGGVRDFV